MIRAQVYFPDDMYRDLKLMAASGGSNFSQLLREGAKWVLEKRKVGKTKEFGAGFIGAGSRGAPKDLSTKIDYYLYGDGNPKWGKKKS